MSHLVTILPSGLSFQVREGETILQAALSHRIDFPNRCRQGVCTSCVCKLKSGQVHYLPPEPLTDLDKSQNFTYCCLAYADSDLVLHHPFIRG
ncbi:2Fe-2S iron-sulfur cluster-binding protein [Rheinheimera sp. 4Y26]|uniref:2Fe-2S iron-sulfur cluster-binding protein n=1 Tax=Rheinheimera sp. 4Y26 TaxID=2977811 RepID=UPI0021B1346D|nr:2Fe-2S iron-sulfur cluster-binding protein [Rheinheimera sp. 4Y26]MCT6698273.1 2Fe-2S iron-sulfur cluster-binding protein [Rheinheimera sp. 4Y26]